MSKEKINENYLNLSEEIKHNIEKKFYEFYDIEKQNTCIFIPLFSLILQGGGNHIQPMITYSERFVCNAISDDFKEVYVFPGYYRDIDDITKESFENILQIISLYQKLYNCSISPRATSENEINRFINFQKQIKKDNSNVVGYDIFENFNKIYCIGLEQTLNKVKEILTSYDEFIKPVVILPREDVFRVNYSSVYNEDCINLTKNNIKELKNFEKEYGVKIFLASNNAGRDSHCEGIALRFYENIFGSEFPIIKSLDEFTTLYTRMIFEEFKRKIDFDKLIEDIYNGNYGDTENEIIENIKNIKLGNHTNQSYLKRYNDVY